VLSCAYISHDAQLVGEFTGNTEALRHAGAVTDLDLALITGGFTVAVATTAPVGPAVTA
jgi:hypothetical protein